MSDQPYVKKKVSMPRRGCIVLGGNSFCKMHSPTSPIDPAGFQSDPGDPGNPKPVFPQLLGSLLDYFPCDRCATTRNLTVWQSMSVSPCNPYKFRGELPPIPTPRSSEDPWGSICIAIRSAFDSRDHNRRTPLMWFFWGTINLHPVPR